MANFVFKKESGDLSYGERRLGRLNGSESEVLVHLYLHRGELVLRDELLDVGWPTKIVTPNSLNMAIKNIRACFEKLNLDDVIITHVKKGFSWNPSYRIDIQDSASTAVTDDSGQQSVVSESIRVLLESDVAPKQDGEDTQVHVSGGGLATHQAGDEGARIQTGGLHAIPRLGDIAGIANRWQQWARSGILLILVVISLSILIFYVTYWTPVDCHDVKGAHLCGVGDLAKDKLPENLAQGEYIYGYKLPNGEFYYVKI